MALDFTFERQIELTRMEYYQDGFAEGEEQGEARGEIRGMARGKKDGLEADMATIAPICQAAEEFAPEYDEEKIFERLKEH